ncbi:MAG: phosphoribosylaminoimidazolesuccinocarboxamide synthase [Candidatus Bathyarchaeota archaeon]|nr:phosphoribosylaminoimidazolesuccinocarboxamide synthase [Candidatus Bathyarchaeota archaeon]
MSFDVVLNTHLPLSSFKKGKVRDLYDLGKKLLIVSTDRISAFDVVLPNGIPYKGEALSRLSAYWFNETKDIVSNHILEVVDPRTVLVKKTKPIKVEFVVRGYLYGSAWENYRKGKPICGTNLPKGLKKAEKLPNPILTPTTKAEVGHDMEMTDEEVAKKIGGDMVRKIEDVCLKIYEKASRKAEVNGIIVADTKMEFGVLDDELILIDELLTPDSSRFWAKEKYEVGKSQPSFDKQYVRDYLTSIGWNRQPPAPRLPEHVVLETSRKYVEAYERLTGRKF